MDRLNWINGWMDGEQWVGGGMDCCAFQNFCNRQLHCCQLFQLLDGFNSLVGLSLTNHKVPLGSEKAVRVSTKIQQQ